MTNDWNDFVRMMEEHNRQLDGENKMNNPMIGKELAKYLETYIAKVVTDFKELKVASIVAIDLSAHIEDDKDCLLTMWGPPELLKFMSRIISENVNDNAFINKDEQLKKYQAGRELKRLAAEYGRAEFSYGDASDKDANELLRLFQERRKTFFALLVELDKHFPSSVEL